MKKEIIISIIFMLFLISCKSIKSSNIDNNIARFKVGSSTEFNVGFFDENKQILFLSEGTLYPFNTGYTVLQNGTDMSVITSQGKVLFNYKTDPSMSWSYSEGFFSSYWSDANKVDVYNSNGKKTKINSSHPVKNGFYVTYNSDNKKMYYKSVTGKKLYTKNNDVYYSDYCDNFNDGFAIVGSNDQYGIINLAAEEIIEKKYLFLGNLKYGYVTASNKSGKKEYKNKTKPAFGIINMNENWIVNPQYYEAIVISPEEAVIKKTSFDNMQDCGWEIYNFNTGKTFTFKKNIDLQIDYESNEIFFDNAAIFCYNNNNEKYGIISSDGNILLDSICSIIEPNPDNGFWQVLINNKWLLFKEGEGLINPEEYLYGNYFEYNFLTKTNKNNTK